MAFFGPIVHLHRKGGDVGRKSGEIVRNVNCNSRWEVGSMKGCHGLHTKRLPHHFQENRNDLCFLEMFLSQTVVLFD